MGRRKYRPIEIQIALAEVRLQRLLGVSTVAACSLVGISPRAYYKWRQKAGDKEKTPRRRLIDKPYKPGVFILKGMNLTIPSFSIKLSDDGQLQTPSIEPQLGLDLCSIWLDVAFQHLVRCEEATIELQLAIDQNDDTKKGNALLAECTAGMQAIVAASIAIDALYAAVSHTVEIPIELKNTWRRKGTARYKQISEVIRRAFQLTPRSAANLAGALKQNQQFRDRAVHPRAGTTKPTLHPQLNVHTEWRFAEFRFFNAKIAVKLALMIVHQLANSKKPNAPQSLKKYCSTLAKAIQPAIGGWEERYGRLTKKASN